ncbi:MAG: TetR/AcrR family transcriptional regulator [Nocardioidaceae bacterium]
MRADAKKNIALIIEAATACLAHNPDTSVNDIAKAAGVGRVTLYGHFPSRSALVAEVVEQAMASTEEALSAVDLTGDPLAAMERLLTATWHLTRRYGALVVAAEQALSSTQLREAHEAPARRVEQLLRRGRRVGSFRTDMPMTWQITTTQAILHGAVQAVHQGEISETHAPDLVAKTVLSTLAPPD